MSDEWKIQRDREGCQKPGCPLPTSRSYFAVLEWAVLPSASEARAKAGDETLPVCVRRELCDACFRDFERRCPDDQPPIFWRAVRRVAENKEPVLDLVSLRALFDRLGAVDDPRARALRFFSALLLVRKRVLKVVRPRSREQEQADLVVVDPKEKQAEPVALFAPAIDPDDFANVKDELLAAISEIGGDGDPEGGDPERGDPGVAGEA